ncbi:MAG TPA: vitamin K epoxide reductase family protein [Pseudomonadales bacterium]|nr:vitamin K epoxide reductase family protein [Pseudomonadales bacterium]
MANIKHDTSLPFRFLPWLLIIGGAIGLLAAAILMIDKIAVLQNPGMQLSCNINPIISCGSVISTSQASAFGFPNPIIGLVGFSVVVTIGAALLAGAAFRRWFWLGLQGGVTFAIGFVTWLQYQSIFEIGALCPFCMVVWTVTIPLFVYVTLYNLVTEHTRVPSSLRPAVKWLAQNHLGIVILWYLAIIMVITYKFWDYWKTLL